MGPSLQHVAAVAPVTALGFLPTPAAPLLLSASGPTITIHSQPPKARRIFTSTHTRIHGLVPSPTHPTILVYGGRTLALTSTASLLALPRPPLREVSAPDWILHALFLPCTHGSIPRVAVVTAHNALYVYSPFGGWALQARGEGGLLYSAHLVLPDEAAGGDPRVLVAAGTIFGTVILWSASTAPTRPQPQTHYRLAGHQGSIHAVSISRLYASGRRYVASCSDDRTVRLWDVSALPALPPGGAETGFGSAPGGAEAVAVGWGHTARIWGVSFLPGEDVRVVSVGEDLAARFWAYGEGGVVNTKSYCLHSGKHVWSFALDGGVLATGGADGRVAVLRYGCEEAEVVVDVRAVLGVEDVVRAYVVGGRERVVVTTNGGRVAVWDLREGWRVVVQREGLRGWSVLGAWRGEGAVVVGGVGEVGVLVEGEQGWEEAWWDVDGKVGGVWTCAGVLGDTTAAATTNATARKTYHLLTTTLSSTSFTLHSFTLPYPTRFTATTLPPPAAEGEKRFLPTAFHTTHSSSHPALALLGSRHGALAAYTLDGTLRGCWSVFKGEGVSAIAAWGEQRVLATCRDGTWAVVEVGERKKGWRGEVVARGGRGGRVVEGVVRGGEAGQGWGGEAGQVRGGEAGQMRVYGFHGKSFVVWDESGGWEVARVDCGGVHRAWAFGEEKGWLVWTKAGKTHLRHLPPPPRLLTPGLHGREIKALALSPTHPLLATGAEDTLIHLSTLTPGHPPAPFATLKHHTTGIHTLTFSPCGTYLLSTGGAGELALWHIRPWGPGGGATITSSLAGTDLRITGADLTPVLDPAGDTTGFLVAAADSGSGVNVYWYNISEHTFTLLVQGRYKTCCLLHAKLVVAAGVRVLLVAAATDGCVIAWDLSAVLAEGGFAVGAEGGVGRAPARGKKRKKKVWVLPEPLVAKRVHQSGVKAMWVCPVLVEGGGVRVWTGGDDCALAETRLVVGGGEVGAESWVLPRAHAGAVVAVVEVRGGVLTVGGDQRVKVWDVGVGVGGGVRGLRGEGCTCVADVAGAVRWGVEGEGEYVIVGGVGVDVWKVEA